MLAHMGTYVRTLAWGVSDAAAPRRRRRSRRGRRARVAGGAAVVAAAGLLLLGAAGGASSPPHHVTVHAGDTLWGIAVAAYGSNDVPARVHDIEAANHLAGAELSPGEVLTLPAP